MRKQISIFLFFALAFFSGTKVMGQKEADSQFPEKKPGMERVNHAYCVRVNNESDAQMIQTRNDMLKDNGVQGTDRGLGELVTAVANSYKTVMVQKTVNATSNLVSLGVSMLTTVVNRNKDNREAWLKMTKEQCQFEKNLGTETSIDDFYYSSSKSGALDPMNMKFNGFSCLGYLKPDGDNADGQKKQADEWPVTGGKQYWEFYVSCKLRDDSVGISHMVNHSKFYLDLDTLIIDTRHLSIPNDGTNGQKLQAFNFDKRKDLTFKINIKVYSSWVNEAIMLTDNQQIGEFNISARIDRDMVKDSIFVFDRNNPRHRESVNLAGDCFIVPRSYTGTASLPSWGTGQYRMDVTIYETCSVNEEYYMVPSVGNGQAIAYANTPGNRKWDKAKWQAEWNEMQQRQKSASVWQNIWKSITTAYMGNNWVQELVAPAANAVYDQEAKSLNELFGIGTDTAVSMSSSSAGSVSTGAATSLPDSAAEGGVGSGQALPQGQ